MHRALGGRNDFHRRNGQQPPAGDGRRARGRRTQPRAPADPKVFTRIHYHFVVRGRNLKRNLVEQAVRLTHEKYCSATAMLGKSAEITKDFEIVED